jgi:hypothetical protein
MRKYISLHLTTTQNLTMRYDKKNHIKNGLILRILLVEI